MKKNIGEAVKILQKASSLGNSDAQYQLACCYENGDGVRIDAPEALKWYRKAADQGNARALVSLGFCYAIGWGLARDYGKALKLFRKAANSRGANEATKNYALALYSRYSRKLAEQREAERRKLAEQREAEQRKLAKKSGKRYCPKCKGSGWVQRPGFPPGWTDRCECRILGRNLTTGEIYYLDNDGKTRSSIRN